MVGEELLVNWDLCCRPKEECGLGFGRIALKNMKLSYLSRHETHFPPNLG